ncbi:MAG: hypothetical protein EPO08_20705 [Rhodospirillaceae bacterium]|nr:MAG: hypothetical protein EPO08_20705 [Rhodospirillaceae bacterium]
MIETTLVVPEAEQQLQSADAQERAREAVAGAILHAIRGLEDLGIERQAAYLTAHPLLLVNVSYCPNAITAEMILEANALATVPAVAIHMRNRPGG